MQLFPRQWCYLLFIGWFSPTLAAVECGSSSPQLATQGDAYYLLNASQPLSQSQQQQLDRFLNPLAGVWSGSLLLRDCEAGERDPDAGSRRYRVKARLQFSASQGLQMQAELNDQLNHLQSQQRIRLAYTDSTTAYRLSKYHLALSEKYRSGNGNGRSRLVEQVMQLKTSASSLDLLTHTFHNGVLVKTEQWHLQP